MNSIQAYLADLTGRSAVPGIQYLVVGGDGVLFEHASGWADLGRRVPVDRGTTMMAYSMSKTITAAAALQLIEAGRLDLDTPVERIIDRWPYGPTVTVRQLIAHTSGLPNPIPLRWVHPAAAHERFDEAAALDAVLRAHPRLSFAPGTGYAYSNIGYWLLGQVIERASGERFTTYVSDRLFRPLGILPGELAYTIGDPAHHATGYLEKYSLMNLGKSLLIDRELVGSYQGRWLEIRGHYPNGPAFGGLVGCAAGFARFLQDQLAQRSVLFNDATREQFYSVQHASGGDPVPMTLGWHVGTRHGVPFFYKEGGGGGFHCMMRLYREQRIGTVVMTNATGFKVARLLDAIDPSGAVQASVRSTSG